MPLVVTLVVTVVVTPAVTAVAEVRWFGSPPPYADAMSVIEAGVELPMLP